MSADSVITENMNRTPDIEGPIPVTPESHPFASMKHYIVPLDPFSYSYVEEEYFLKGKTAIYETNTDDWTAIKKQGLPYKPRVLVRRPADMSKFSGRVYVDILNATQQYDNEDCWHRSAEWCMANYHGYVGITSKPITAYSLKRFDYKRYQSLNWSNGDLVPMPVVPYNHSIKGTEEGLVWDMFGQLAVLIKYGAGKNLFCGTEVKFIYLCGQSQSGMYLNTFVHYFDPYLQGKDGRKLFDGYLNLVGVNFMRGLIQNAEPAGMMSAMSAMNIRPTGTPFISVTSEGDITLFGSALNEETVKYNTANSNVTGNKRRHYDIAGSPHCDVLCTKRPCLDDIKVMGFSTIPTDFYIIALIEKLHIWASTGVAPEIVQPFTIIAKSQNAHGKINPEIQAARDPTNLKKKKKKWVLIGN
jgi:hypothetical protein